jgi:copper transport protein
VTRWGTVPVLALLGVLTFAPPGGAHALLRQSDPEGGAVLTRSPNDVTIEFTEEPEASLSGVHVLDSTGRPVEQGPAHAVPAHPLDLSVPVSNLPKGLYTVSWRTVSRVDGHVTGGAFAFGVGVAPGEAPEAEAVSPLPSPAAVFGRWGLYAGLSALLGAAWVWSVVLPEPPAAGFSYLWLAWAASALGLIALGWAQAADAGVGVARLLGTSLGRALWGRAIPIVAAGAAIAAARVLPAHWRRPAFAALGLSAASAMLAHVLAGHAGANTGPWRWPNVADQWVHFMGVGVWMGGLGALLVALRGAPAVDKASAARRFSAVALIAVVVVAGTGVLRAVDEVGSWAALLSTRFGLLVLLKAGLLLVLVALGAVNRYRSIPAAVRTLRGLRRVGGTELAVAAVVLGVTGVLTGLAPASLTGPRPGPGLVVSGSDYATSVRLRLEVSPGLVGPNRFVARIADYDTGRPIGAARVTLRFTKPDRPDLGRSTLTLVRAADGAYQARGTNLSLDGPWAVAAVIERGKDSVEIPLAVATRSRPQRVRTIEAPGQPTLYSIDLPGNRLLNVYLDPARAGPNEVHVTFIDASGGELPIPRPAAVTVARSGSTPITPPVRRFGPGHFIADTQLAAGDWRLDIVATTEGGEVLEAHLTVHL